MTKTRRSFIVGVLATVLGTATASAQFLPGNNPYFRPTGGVTAGVPAAMAVPQPAAPVVPLLPGGGNLVTNPYNSLLPSPIPPSPFISPYAPFYNPAAGGAYLSGAADVMNAQGRFLLDRQDALLKREQVKQMKLDTRRKTLDAWLDERSRIPRPEQLRQEAIREQLGRSLSNPPVNEIASGIALNNILGSLESMTLGKTASVPPIKLPEDAIKKVNVTKGSGTVNAGVLRNEGKLTWPRSIESLQPVERATELRNKIDARTREAYTQASSGQVDGELIKELQSMSAELNGLVARTINSTGFQEYTEARKFMKNLDDSIAVLARTDARDFLEAGDVGKSETVQDLVLNMSAKGLRFAPAVGTNEAAYVALHRAMVQYHTALTADQEK